jgi:hypothetical protein
MKTLAIFLFMIGSLLHADIEVKQNMKALYRGVELTPVQEDYIFDNQEITRRIMLNTARKEAKSLKNRGYVNEKNVVEFVLNPDGSMGKLRYLSRSDERYIDKLTRTIIQKAYKKFPKPEEATPIRYIFVYQIGKDNAITLHSGAIQNSTGSRYQGIARGTTRFQHSSKEYVKMFETSRDGFVNMNTDPWNCAKRVTLLTHQNQRVNTGIGGNYQFNIEVPKGKYKLLVLTRQTCNINLQYP